MRYLLALLVPLSVLSSSCQIDKECPQILETVAKDLELAHNRIERLEEALRLAETYEPKLHRCQTVAETMTEFAKQCIKEKKGSSL